MALPHQNLKITSIKTKELAHKALVRPLLEYTSTVWHSIIKKDTSRIQMIQRKVACFVLHDFKTTSSIDKMLRKLNWLSLED